MNRVSEPTACGFCVKDTSDNLQPDSSGLPEGQLGQHF